MKNKFISNTILFKIILLVFFFSTLYACNNRSSELETLNTKLEVEKPNIKSISQVAYSYLYNNSNLFTGFDARTKIQHHYYYYYFNEKGNLMMKIDWENDRSSDTLIYQFKYNHKDILEEAKISDRRNRVYEEHFFKYDDYGNVVSILSKDYWTKILEYPGPELDIHKTTFKYNDENKLIEETTFNEVNNSITDQYIISYDKNGNSKRDTIKKSFYKHFGNKMKKIRSDLDSKFFNPDGNEVNVSIAISVDGYGFINEEVSLLPFGKRIYDPETESWVEPKYSTFKVYQMINRIVEYY